jgi:hypothetical protein
MLIEESLNLPRLTGTLRAFSKVSKKFVDPDPEQDRKLIRKRKEQRLKQQEFGNQQADSSKETAPLSWDTLMLKLVPNLNETKYSKLKVSLDKLKLNIAKQFLNEDFNEHALLNEAAFFIFCTFYDYRASDNVGLSNSNFQHIDKLMKKLREKFGQFARNLFDSCKEVMETIYNDLKNTQRMFLLDEMLASRHIEILTAEDVESAHKFDGGSGGESYFGENIKFISFYDKLGQQQNKADAANDNDDDDESMSGSSDDDTDGDTDTEIDFKFPVDSVPKTSDSLNDHLKYIQWTQDLSKELCNIIFETLSKKPNSNEAQNELLELLGFEKIELIEFLFSNADAVVKAYTMYMNDVGRNKKNLGKMSAVQTQIEKQKQAESAKPIVASEILVHTETEKKIKKQIRKGMLINLKKI